MSAGGRGDHPSHCTDSAVPSVPSVCTYDVLCNSRCSACITGLAFSCVKSVWISVICSVPSQVVTIFFFKSWFIALNWKFWVCEKVCVQCRNRGLFGSSVFLVCRKQRFLQVSRIFLVLIISTTKIRYICVFTNALLYNIWGTSVFLFACKNPLLLLCSVLRCLAPPLFIIENETRTFFRDWCITSSSRSKHRRRNRVSMVIHYKTKINLLVRYQQY